ncbi:MAG TPA: 2-C-methyl-D-erythritol 4-phosphate cytidylyltransferase [Candidatus Gastranaerophilales bacterium]|nr:2-C-methyl-D-erythritol 4-phosphate cytidylyltransferase [Candidatus Gastranaerophilales bacterium]
MKISAIIPAAGSGERYSSFKHKLLEEVNGIPVIIHTINAISAVEEIEDIIICASLDLIEKISEEVKKNNVLKVKKIILGGKTRQESVFKGLKELNKLIEPDKKPDFVLIHDGARPLISVDVIKNTILTALEKNACITAVPVKDTIKRVNNLTGEVIETLNRQELWQIQTPQVFRFAEILKAHELFEGENLTDDSALMEKAGYKVFVSEGSYKNIKITTEEDFKIIQAFLF